MKNFFTVILGLCLFLASIAKNPLECSITILAAFIYLSNFLKEREHPLILLALLIPFTEISTSLINAEIQGLSINAYFGNGGEKAYVLSIVAFVFFMLGLLRGVHNTLKFKIEESVENLLRQISMERLIYGHFAMHGLHLLCQNLFRYGSVFFQLTLHISNFPLIFLYLIVWKFSLERKNHIYVIGLFLINLALRISGFFADWKALFFMLFYIMFISHKKLDYYLTKRLVITGSLGLIFLFSWQAIKVNYREFLNGGEKSQEVVVSANDAISKFSELITGYWLSNKSEAIQTDKTLQETLDRVGYLSFFSQTIERVPSLIPHEAGRLLLNNLSFVLLPRFLFTNKGIKNDQLKVEKYAGVEIADHASFSLGRYAEWYVDFGLGMIIIAFVFGLGGSVILRILNQKQESNEFKLIDPIYSFLILQTFCSFQMDEILILGQSIWGMIIYLTFGRRLFIPFIRKKT